MEHETSNVNLRVWDIHESYSRVSNSVLGIIQVICGLLSMALGVGAICTISSGYNIGYGIWCGFMFTLTGGLCIGAARHKNTCLIMTNLTLCIICSCLGWIQFGIGVVAADNDQYSHRGDIIVGQFGPNYLQYDIYYVYNNPNSYLCGGVNYNLNWSGAWGPIDVLLLLTGAIEAITASVAAILCCNSVCCGERTVTAPMTRGNYYQGTGTTGYSNDGYMTESRHMTPSPPLYKVM